ncbi:MAG: inorganic diphosphatase [Candidatus Micrarchaeota archaeon]|nr:inorganic diphosphatase [Candidatus Micrarchaeota archaeon]
MKLTAGKEAPEVVNAFIEIPMGSDIKYEFDEASEVIKVDRLLYTQMVYPMNYGFIPGTRAKDGDAVDILVMSERSFMPGTYVEARPIGVLLMQDEEGLDHKIIAVPKGKVDPSFGDIKDISQIPDFKIKRWTHFFEHYKELEPGKMVKIKGWGNAEQAKKIIKESMKKK